MGEAPIGHPYLVSDVKSAGSANRARHRNGRLLDPVFSRTAGVGNKLPPLL
jgi:hypothetical protein